MSDDEEFTDTPSLSDVVIDGTYEQALDAMVAYVAHELEGNRCKTCRMSQLRTGDTAALVLRLQKLLEERQTLSPASAEADARAKGVTTLASLRERRASGGGSAPQASDDSRLGSKSAPRRQGGRQPRFRSD